MTSELVVLQHDPGSGPAAFAEVLDARRSIVGWRLVELDADAQVPELDALAGIVALGAPAGLADEEPPAWLDAELELLRSAVEAEVPVLGVGLGAHVLLTALGGKVERRARPRVGFHALSRTEAAGDEPVAAGWPDGTAALFLERDGVAALPEGAEVVLAGDDADDPGAWRLGSGLAVHFRPEVTVEQLEAWAGEAWLEERLAAGGLDADGLLEEARTRVRFTVPQGRALIGRFLDDPVRKHVSD